MPGHGHSHEPPRAEELRAHGRRLTRQRRLLWDELVAEPEAHLSADELAARAGLEPSTVYRTLDMLVEEGLVTRTDLGAGRAFFEPAQEHLHHHVVCERCGAVAHVHDADLGDLRERVEAASGYEVAASDLTLFGLCPRCRA